MSGKNTYYSLTIKRQVIKRIQSGELSQAAAAREYGIGGSMTISRWLSRSEEILGIPKDKEMFSDEKNESNLDDNFLSKRMLELHEELELLKLSLKQEKLRSEAYKTMIKIAEEKYKIPIEKKYGAKQLNK